MLANTHTFFYVYINILTYERRIRSIRAITHQTNDHLYTPATTLPHPTKIFINHDFLRLRGALSDALVLPRRHIQSHTASSRPG